MDRIAVLGVAWALGVGGCAGSGRGAAEARPGGQAACSELRDDVPRELPRKGPFAACLRCHTGEDAEGGNLYRMGVDVTAKYAL